MNKRFLLLWLAYSTLAGSLYSVAIWGFPPVVPLTKALHQVIIAIGCLFPAALIAGNYSFRNSATILKNPIVFFDALKSRRDWFRFWALCNALVVTVGLTGHFLTGRPTWAEIAFVQLMTPTTFCLAGWLLKMDRQRVAETINPPIVSTIPRTTTTVRRENADADTRTAYPTIARSTDTADEPHIPLVVGRRR